MLELFIGRVVIVGEYWDAVFDVEGEAQTAVVDEQNLVQASVLNHPQVLDVAKLCADAVLAVEPEVEDDAEGVQVVDDGVCVGLLAGSERYDLIILF